MAEFILYSFFVIVGITLFFTELLFFFVYFANKGNVWWLMNRRTVKVIQAVKKLKNNS